MRFRAVLKCPNALPAAVDKHGTMTMMENKQIYSDHKRQLEAWSDEVLIMAPRGSVVEIQEQAWTVLERRT